MVFLSILNKKVRVGTLRVGTFQRRNFTIKHRSIHALTPLYYDINRSSFRIRADFLSQLDSPRVTHKTYILKWNLWRPCYLLVWFLPILFSTKCFWNHMVDLRPNRVFKKVQLKKSTKMFDQFNLLWQRRAKEQFRNRYLTVRKSAFILWLLE